MPRVDLPFETTDWSESTHQEPGCPACSQFPEDLLGASREFVHLRRYLHNLPIQDCGVPKFAPKLERSMSGEENVNLIYPVSHESFAHILSDSDDARNYYLPIEPTALSDYDDLVAIIE
jgi:flagellar protein FlaI